MFVTIQCAEDRRSVFFSSPRVVSEILKREDINFEFPCSGIGKCGKCKVKISGSVSPVTDEEKRLLTQDEIKQGVRLACCAVANGNILINYTISENFFQAFLKKYIDFVAKFDKNNEYDLVYEIGTTTINVRAVETGADKSFDFSFINPQVKFGADVMSRLKYANDCSPEELFKCVREPFEYINKKLSIRRCVVTGNTVMLHLFNNIDTSGLTSFPFTPTDFFGYSKGNVYFPTCIGAFVGADISCGILKSNMQEIKNSLLIDVGTNCEMAFNRNGETVCCSVAAGPAFEGFSVRNGQRAKNGAVSKVFLENGIIKYETVGNVEPSGITGSGLIDLLGVMLEKGIIKQDGYLEDNFFIPGTEIFITPEDVRNLQLAKASVRAGIDILCKNEEISKVFVAGNFGNSLDIKSCVKIGMFPPDFEEKAQFIGNSSLDGATLLLAENSRKTLEDISKKIKTVELAGTEEFAKKYIESINFNA